LSTLEELARHARGGDEASKEALARRSYEPVYALCRRLRAEPEAARDAAQETFVQIYANLERWDESRAFMPWAMGIARNVCRNGHRRDAKRPVDLVEVDRVAADADPEVPALIAAREDSDLVRAAFARLPEDQRAVIAGRLLDGQTSREVGDRLAVSEGAVRVRLHRALAALRAEVAATRRERFESARAARDEASAAREQVPATLAKEKQS